MSSADIEPSELNALTEAENVPDVEPSEPDAVAGAEDVPDISDEADVLARISTVSPAGQSADKLFALLGEAQKLLAETDVLDADDFAAAIQRVATAKPTLADEARNLVRELRHDNDLLTRSVIKRASENLYRLLRFSMMCYQMPNMRTWGRIACGAVIYSSA